MQLSFGVAIVSTVRSAWAKVGYETIEDRASDSFTVDVNPVLAEIFQESDTWSYHWKRVFSDDRDHASA